MGVVTCPGEGFLYGGGYGHSVWESVGSCHGPLPRSPVNRQTALKTLLPSIKIPGFKKLCGSLLMFKTQIDECLHMDVRKIPTPLTFY